MTSLNHATLDVDHLSCEEVSVYSDSQEDMDDMGILSIPLSKEDESCLYQPWNQSLLVRVVGKNVGCGLMIPRLKGLGKLRNPISGFDIGEYYFIVEFSDSTDFARALNGGAWVFSLTFHFG